MRTAATPDNRHSSLPSLPVLNVDNAQLLGDEEDVVKWRPDVRFGRVQVGERLWVVLKILQIDSLPAQF